ncbi:hypothetical protein BBJ28_00001829 [Nothophytophthora sp. Chile5]|nr:hypothetical protein BBJ28_00001829 [Nothophytophthora sp. Chile5]
MDLAAVWQEVALFHENGIVTSAHIHAGEQENTVHEFLEKVPISALFACLQDASDRGSAEQVGSLRCLRIRCEITESSVEFMRYLETIAKICAQKDEHMEYGISTHAVDLILDCLKSNDPLFLMNVVDLVPKVCQTKIGVQYIFQSDLFVGGNAVRLVGEISATAAKLDIDSWSWSDATLSKAFLETVGAKLQSTDSLQQIAAMDALAAFGSSSEKGDVCLGSSAKMPVKADCFHSLARILGEPTRLTKQPEQVPAENAEIWSLCERLFNSLGAECVQQPTLVFLMDALKQPFEELRTSVFHVLRSVAAQNNDWGMRALLSYGGFFEFLMDRSTEPTKETREWKFAVLDAVLASPFQSQLGQWAATFCSDGHTPRVCVMDTPTRAAFLCTSTAEFHPPEWACMPIEANAHARLEAFRDSRHCATYMVATQLVNLFGRDQDSCDHVLGNPSISRKHAAVIHDNAGGIYMVDLMSRHGTYVGRKKIPPHDPFLLHGKRLEFIGVAGFVLTAWRWDLMGGTEGDVVKFGQSVRVYILKGASSDGNSAPVKKSWGRKLRAPHVSISAVLPKMGPSKPKACAAATKIVNAVCYGTLKDEKVDTFLAAVLELSDEERKDVADTLVERMQAKYEFYAAHVHRNAFVATMALLKQNLCVQEFEDNLTILTHISQHRYDSIYRADARKLLQLMAAIRLDPENPQFNDTDSVVSNEEDAGSACPPTASNRKTRERVLSDEGKKLFLSGHGLPFPDRADSTETASESGVSTITNRETMDNADPRYRTTRYPSSVYSSEYDDNDAESESRSVDNGYAPPLHPINGNGNGYSHHEQPAVRSAGSGSGFNFIGQAAPGSGNANGSAFGFIANADPVDDGPKPPAVAVEDFLVAHPSVADGEFEEMWESANGESYVGHLVAGVSHTCVANVLSVHCREEWSVDVGTLDAHELDAHELQLFLESYRMLCLSSEKVAGQQQWLFAAEQVE